MRLYIGLGAALLSGAFMLASCHKGDTVQADYQPRPAPDAIAQMRVGKYGKREIQGQLRGVDVPRKTLVMRVENGMDQTFLWNDDTEVTGLRPSQKKTLLSV